jgi:hypothetical protein
MRALLVLVALLLGACTDDYDERFDPPRHDRHPWEVVVQSGVVTRLGQASVGAFAVDWGTFLDADGHAREGDSIMLSDVTQDHGARRITVGLGTVFQMGGTVWRVTKIKTPPHGGAIVQCIGPRNDVSGCGVALRSRSRGQ